MEAAPPTSRCDISGNAVATIADVQAEINQALGLAGANDLNNDSAVNVVDLQIVVNAVLKLGCAVDPPAITDFNPKSGPIGTLVSVTGSNFGIAPQISVPSLGGGTLNPPSNFSATGTSFVVPAGAASGAIQIATPYGSATSTATLTVTPSTGFTVSATPPTANLIQGQSVSYAVSLASTNGFSQLAQLSVSGLPSGITADFAPASITAGQTSVLTLTAPASQPIANASLGISAAATVDGMPVTQGASVSLSTVVPTTSLIGRTVVSDSPETPLAGVTITTLDKDGNGNITGCTGQTTVSDAAGNFALTNLPMACTGPQLIGFDGTTATAPAGKYAGVNLVFSLSSGQVTASAVLVHLPRIDTVETFPVTQDSPSIQTYSYTSIPGLSVTVYPNTTFTMPDGTQPNPFPLAAVQVPVDRLPDAKPNVPTMIRAFIVAFQPANATTNQPVAVSFPNTLNTAPGTDMVLMTLDPTHGQMVPYGTGAVSTDGTQIVPDADPAHSGHLYGLVHFDWHGPMPPPPPEPDPPPDPGCPGCQTPEPQPHKPGRCNDPNTGPESGDPVDITSGLQVIRATDIVLGGRVNPVWITRTYRTLSSNPGPFGIGTGYNYGYQLATKGFVIEGGPIYLVMANGNQYPFFLLPNGTLVNYTNPALRGVTITPLNTSPRSYSFRRREGTTLLFQSPSTGPFIAYLNSIADPNGNTITLVHGNSSSPDQVTQVIDPFGRALVIGYDSSDRIVLIQDPIGRKVSYTYNSQGTLATVTNAAGGVTSYTYDSQNRVTQITDARGIVTAQNTYDANGRVMSQVQGDGSVIQFAYTLLNPLAPASPLMSTTVTDQRGNTTTYRYDPTGALLQVTDATGQYQTFQKDLNHNNVVTAATGGGICPSCNNPKFGDVQFSYDSAGNMLTRTDALGNTMTYSYDPATNKVNQIADALGSTAKYTYDAHGNKLTSSDANGHTLTYAYNSFGEVTQTTDSQGQITTYTYDSDGNLAAITGPLGETYSFVYDAVSRPVQMVDPLGRKTTLIYDALDRLAAQQNALGNTVQYSYDAIGNLLSATDANSKTTSYSYDAMHRLVSKTDPAGQTDTRSYDPFGNLIKFTDRNGQVTALTYDVLNRLSSQTYQDGSHSTASYDARGRLAQVQDSVGGTFAYTYDSAGHLTSQSSQFGTVLYTYDARGSVASRQVVGQPAISYTYNSGGNLLSAAMPQATDTFAYDNRNQLSQIMRSNGVSSQYSYDAEGRAVSIVHSGGQGIQFPLSYAYDAANDRSSFTSGVAAPTAVSNTFDPSGRLIQSGATNYTYDLNGNLTSATSSAGVTSFAWDARNRLQSITSPNGQKTQLLYDYAHNLISQIDSGPIQNLVQSFVLDGDNVAYIGKSNGDNLSVLAGRVVDSHLAVIHSSGQVEFGLPDAVNSTVATTNQSGGLTATFSYEPFGNTTTTSTYPFQFTGRVPIGGSLYYYRARYCDTQAGRFISEDPISSFAGGSAYVYARNGPLALVDPQGMAPSPFGTACGYAGMIAGNIGTEADSQYFTIAGMIFDAGSCLSSGPGCALSLALDLAFATGTPTQYSTDGCVAESPFCSADEPAMCPAPPPPNPFAPPPVQICSPWAPAQPDYGPPPQVLPFSPEGSGPIPFPSGQ
jgi:RHS repeat-associated protein